MRTVRAIGATLGSIGTPAARYSSAWRIARAQKCGGVQTKMIAKSSTAAHESEPATAAHPTSTGTAPAAPPITMFCVLVRFSHSV